MSYFYFYYFNCTINGQSHAFSYNFGTIVNVTFKIALGYASCNYETVTSTIIPKLYSNACDYTKPWYNYYISREMSIERPSVGLASLAQLENWFPLQGEQIQSLKVFNGRMLGFKNKIETRKRRQNNNRHINLSQGTNILYILHVH